MRSVVMGTAAMVVISLVAWIVLDTQSTTSADHLSGEKESVRLD